MKLNTDLCRDAVILLLEVYPTEMKRSLQNNVYTNVYSNFIHNSRKLETKISLDKRPNNKIVVNSYNRMLSNATEGTTDRLNNVDESQTS